MSAKRVRANATKVAASKVTASKVTATKVAASKVTEPRRTAHATERALVIAATSLFARNGYNGTSVSEVAGQLGLTTASLYYYVTGKQDLLMRVLSTGMSDFLQRLEALARQPISNREKVRIAVENHLDFVLGNQEAVTVFLRERRFLESPYRERYQTQVDRYDELFTEFIVAGVRDGELPPVDPHVTRLAILGMINWLVEWYEPGGRLTPFEIKLTMSNLIMQRLLG
ncbi:MAG: TetR family transcriptional regulator [Micromonosporaceae bacterium]|nr:TetR family transcriptional regulator [Micromonosporaceae bacterium]